MPPDKTFRISTYLCNKLDSSFAEITRVKQKNVSTCRPGNGSIGCHLCIEELLTTWQVGNFGPVDPLAPGKLPTQMCVFPIPWGLIYGCFPKIPNMAGENNGKPY